MPAVEHIGRMRYAAPEIIAQTGPQQNQQRSPTVSEAADVWAFGMVAYELLTHERIFPEGVVAADVRQAAFASRFDGGYPWEMGAKGSNDRNSNLKRMRRVVLQCLNRDPNDRPSTQAMVAHWESMLDSITS